jgi:hypothetical protein
MATSQKSDLREGRFSLAEIKEALVYRALEKKMFLPLRSFFQTMELKWGSTATAHAELVEGCPVIVLGITFFENEVQSISEAVDLVLHEIMHHLFRHLEMVPELLQQGYSIRIQNLAMDAVINAYLHSVQSAGFMERYYEAKGEFAFLRPNSEIEHPKRLWREFTRQNYWNVKRHSEFYERLYKLQVDLTESLRFFQENFADKRPADKKQFIGGTQEDQHVGEPRKAPQSKSSMPGNGKRGKEEESAQPSKQGEQKGDESKGESGQATAGNSIFGDKEAHQILKDLGVIKASQKAKNNFLEVIRKVTVATTRPGSVRTGTTYSRRVPAKMGRRDLLNVERDRNLFSRANYQLREVWLFIDASGTMSTYRTFCIDLIKSLQREYLEVHAVVWANSITEMPVADLLKGNFPKVGSGTDGEMVAQFIAEHKVPQAVIITDNIAGEITTKLSARVLVCLVKGGWTSGSFLDRSKIPHSEAFQLEP